MPGRYDSHASAADCFVKNPTKPLYLVMFPFTRECNFPFRNRNMLRPRMQDALFRFPNFWKSRYRRHRNEALQLTQSVQCSSFVRLKSSGQGCLVQYRGNRSPALTVIENQQEFLHRGGAHDPASYHGKRWSTRSETLPVKA